MKASSLFVLVWVVTASALAQESTPSIADKTSGMQHLEGYFDVYWDEDTGKLFWEIDKLDTEFLYAVSLSSGLGSNPVGLDRGQLGGTYILVAQRVGPRILLMEPNYGYRARSDNENEVNAVRDAFAPSVHWGFDVAAASGDSILVDATDFFLRDTHGAAARIERAGQGTFQLDRTRSVFYLPRTKAFPENTEIETLLTFTSNNPGALVRSVAASGEAITLRQHHSLVALPDDAFEPREADPRIGVFGPTFHDYATPIDESLVVRWVARHRLEKQNPDAARSEAVEPIVYYLDPGVPEPIKSALLDGARWWEQAFEAAGFIDAYRVEVLPADADPQDIRYNMIHWTHRSTRGWSYGGSVTDPRTGEIIKGNVNLGSLRLRQDYLMGQGMTAPFANDQAGLNACGLSTAPGFAYLAQVGEGATPVEMALARVRQLSAHEVGHTLGFPHNYMASTYGGRASVMDYPAPLVQIRDGQLNLSDAYAVGIGDYDKISVRWLYGDFAAGADEKQELNAIVEEGLRSERRFMTHTDNYIGAGAHPLASVWDNGGNLVDMLEHEIEVRRLGLESFGPSVLRVGEPLSLLEKALVPLYLHHRYQMKAAMNTVGGVDYYYALRGDGQTPATIVPGTEQRRALGAILETLSAEFLAVPEDVVEMIPPPAYRYDQGEMFPRHTGLLFDPLTAADVSADYTVELLLHPERAARLVDHHARDTSHLGLEEVVESLMSATWDQPIPSDSYLAGVQEVAQRSVLDGLFEQSQNPENPSRVRAVYNASLDALAERLDEDQSPHQRLASADIRRWQARPFGVVPEPDKPATPPGSPIGSPR